MKTTSEPAARLLRIRGLVQGVGYRNALQSEATRLKLSGWVRNRSDGSVEALVAGSMEALETLIAWARRGPPAARVAELVWESAESPAQTGFVRLETL
ncbi:acylphosphatase [Zoogloea sp.]|uniref:acylphosphatase n=1 Tax=Zoogloea sp. TaxID=49181 RepID=UPI002C69E405|nr:acylphosphatase [Zoogloea sp.]